MTPVSAINHSNARARSYLEQVECISPNVVLQMTVSERVDVLREGDSVSVMSSLYISNSANTHVPELIKLVIRLSMSVTYLNTLHKWLCITNNITRCVCVELVYNVDKERGYDISLRVNLVATH